MLMYGIISDQNSNLELFSLIPGRLVRLHIASTINCADFNKLLRSSTSAIHFMTADIGRPQK